MHWTPGSDRLTDGHIRIREMLDAIACQVTEVVASDDSRGVQRRYGLTGAVVLLAVSLDLPAASAHGRSSNTSRQGRSCTVSASGNMIR